MAFNDIAVLASGSGTTFESLVETQWVHRGKIKLLIVDRTCGAQEKAKKLDIPCIELKNSDAIFSACRAFNIHLVCCAGWLRKLKIPADFSINSTCSKVMNIHPSLLPSFGGKGMYGMNVHKAVYEAGVKITGCTVHFVDDEYDHGPIIVQRQVYVWPEDTPEVIQQKVQTEERSFYPVAIQMFFSGLKIDGRRVIEQKIATQPAPG